MKTKGNLLKLCLLGLGLLLPAAAQAQFTFTTNNGSATITHYTGSKTNGLVTIPDTIAGWPVTSIGNRAFYGTAVTNVLIPDSVTNIAYEAFDNCASLTNVTLGSGVIFIGDMAFGVCKALTSVGCRGNAASLGGVNVFLSAPATVYYLPGTTGWGSSFGARPAVLWNPPVPYTYTTNNETITITRYTGSSTVPAIPNKIDFLPVAGIGELTFFETEITSVVIPNSVGNIGINAFCDCHSLTSIIIPNSVTNIEAYAFYFCDNLASVIIPNSVTGIQENTFSDCTGLAQVTIPNSVTSIAQGAFFDCTSLTSVLLPDSVTNIDCGAFSDCTSLANITIPDSVISIGESAFDLCGSLTNVTIPDSVTSIGEWAFGDCNNLASITIGTGVTNIEGYTFVYSSNLRSIYFRGNAPGNSPGYSFAYVSATIYYLPGTLGWSAFATNAGMATKLWLPTMQTSDGSFGKLANDFGFKFNWASGQTVVVEASTNLSNPIWQPVQTNTLTSGTSYFSDPQWTNYPGRFYRLRSP